jgi:hypothetical protein
MPSVFFTQISARRRCTVRRWGFSARKFNNTPTEVDGWKFDSLSEARHYGRLKLLKSAGEILHFDIHPAFHLAPGVRYTADFMVYYPDGRIEVQDVKGGRATATEAFKVRQRLFDAGHPLAPLVIVTM